MAKSNKSNSIKAAVSLTSEQLDRARIDHPVDVVVAEQATPTVPPTGDPVVDAIANALGAGGEVTTPDPVPVVQGNGSFNLMGAIRQALTTMGTDTSRELVMDFITNRYPGQMINMGSFTNGLSVVRKSFREGNGHTPTSKVVDLADAVRLCQSLHMTPAALVALLTTLSAVGTVDAIQTALTQVIALSELINAGKTV